MKVVSATEPISEDSTGILLESLLEGYAEFYSAELSEKVRRGHTENALKAKYNDGGMPMGYNKSEDKTYEIDTELAPIVLACFTRYAEGQTIREIVEWMNQSGVKSRKGYPITINIVTNMLKNRRYTGEYVYADMVLPGGIPQIVPEELFDRVQQRMEKNKRAPARHKGRGRLSLDHQAVLRPLRGIYGGRVRPEPYRGGSPLLQMRQQQEGARLQETGREKGLD